MRLFFYQELCRHGIILNHRIMALYTLRLAQTARDYLDAGCDVIPQSLLDTYEKTMTNRRNEIEIMNS